MDGLDIALVKFTTGFADASSAETQYTFQILTAETLPYPEHWTKQLSEAFHKQPKDLVQLGKDYGKYLGEQVLAFAKKHNAHPDFVASHGHTIFHKPEQHYTLQIGDGQELTKACGFTVINDFRSEDVSKGGQGAPLVPIGDRLLFSDYDICLNIGGIANLSYEEGGNRIAYDICIANQALNYLAQRQGRHYDKDGLLARHGRVSDTLLQALDDNDYFRLAPPKSLGREFFESCQRHLLESYPTEDALATFTEHIARQTARCVAHLPQGNILVTGGGAHNLFLIERLQHHTPHQVVVPDRQTVDYKEALIFALLGLLRLEGHTNVLRSVTGASSDSCSGQIWKPKS